MHINIISEKNQCKQSHSLLKNNNQHVCIMWYFLKVLPAQSCCISEYWIPTYFKAKLVVKLVVCVGLTWLNDNTVYTFFLVDNLTNLTTPRSPPTGLFIPPSTCFCINDSQVLENSIPSEQLAEILERRGKEYKKNQARYKPPPTPGTILAYFIAIKFELVKLFWTSK